MNPPTFNPDLAYPLFPRESSPTLGFAQGSMNHPLHTPTEYYDCGIQNYCTCPNSRSVTYKLIPVAQNLLPVAQSLELSHRELAYPNSDLPVPRDMIYDNFSLEMSLLLGSKSTNPPSTSPPQLLSTHSHSYRQRDAASVEMWLELCNDKIGSICKCRWPFCSERFVYGSNNAHMHVHKHLRTKAYECTTW